MSSNDGSPSAPQEPRWASWRRPAGMGDPDPELEIEHEPKRYRGGAFRQTARRFGRQRASMFAVAVLGLLTMLSIAAPLVATHDPNAIDLSNSLVGPSLDHWLGTDELGRDTFSRLIFAGRVSLAAAVQALAVALAIGAPLGLAAGYFRGRVDSLISVVTDSIMALPALLLAIAIIGAIGPGLTRAMIAVGVIFAPRFIRLLRSTVISIREDTYIEAAVTTGSTSTRIMLRHVFPNAMPPLLVQAAFTTGYAMLAEASLSFLGLGVQAPQASWGSMISAAYATVNRSIWPPFPPGIAIAMAVLSFNVVGDGLRAAIGREEYR